MKTIYKLSAGIYVGFMTVSCASYTQWLSEYQSYKPYRSSTDNQFSNNSSLYSREDPYCPDTMSSSRSRNQQPNRVSLDHLLRVDSKADQVKSSIEKIMRINSSIDAIKIPNKRRVK